MTSKYSLKARLIFSEILIILTAMPLIYIQLHMFIIGFEISLPSIYLFLLYTS
jgi:hypothetical protein